MNTGTEKGLSEYWERKRVSLNTGTENGLI